MGCVSQQQLNAAYQLLPHGPALRAIDAISALSTAPWPLNQTMYYTRSAAPSAVLLAWSTPLKPLPYTVF